jgi:hypothetical protein
MAKAPVKKNVATFVVEVEFEVDSTSLSDIMNSIDCAQEELRAYGYIKSAKLTIPATEMDLT